MRRPSDQRATSSGGHASPATTTVAPAGSASSGSTASAVGGRVTCVTSCSAQSAARSGPGISRSAGATTRVAPDRSPITISQAAASKLSAANCSTRLPGPTPNASRWARAREAMPPCGTTTPLGRPVEPDV
ncbi:hypothetical protein ADK88_21300 [Streptomyces sp. NRRL F-2295]|nr:hypothetical protein ADK88_21300 [Streptomyces sp. NRRL F-2295]